MGDSLVVSAALFYLISSTLSIAALFMLIELVERAREPGADVLTVTMEVYGDDVDEEEARGVTMPGALAVLGLLALLVRWWDLSPRLAVAFLALWVLKDLALSYRPVELRSKLEEARRDNRPVLVVQVQHEVRRTASTLNVEVVPQLGQNGNLFGFVLNFIDVTGMRLLEQERERSRRELEDAYEELQSTSEEMETTNEELQSTVEELETTNEELQSTNEELETMNEELQSTNEELETINDEVRQRGEDLNHANRFLESVLTSLRSGVGVVDRELRILAWNRHAEELWGMRSDEVSGQHLLNLDIGLPVQKLRPALKACLSGESTHEQLILDAVNRRGKKILCQVTCSPLLGSEASVTGAIIVMDELNDSRPPERVTS